MVTAENNNSEMKLSLKERWSSFFSGATLKPFFICLVLQFIQNWCGVIVIIFKTIHVFQTFHTSVDYKLATIIVGVVAFVSTFCKKAIKITTKYEADVISSVFDVD